MEICRLSTCELLLFPWLQFDEEHGGDHGEARQQHGHFGDSVPAGAELVRQDLHEGDVDEGSPRIGRAHV